MLFQTGCSSITAGTAINNKLFEYWITHDDANYNTLIEGVQNFIDQPQRAATMVPALATLTLHRATLHRAAHLLHSPLRKRSRRASFRPEPYRLGDAPQRPPIPPPGRPRGPYCRRRAASVWP